MAMLMRFDPFRDADRLAQELLAGRAGGAPRGFPMDAYRRGDRFFVHLDLPGVDPDSIELTAEQSVLTISAERRFECTKVTNCLSASARRERSRASSS